MKFRMLTATAMVALMVTLSGCNEQAPVKSGPDTVVVDVVAVAKALGRDDTFRSQMQAVNQKLNEQLQAIQRNLQEQVDAKKAEFGEELTEEQTQQLRRLTQAANQRLAQARFVAQQRQAQVSGALGNQFRDEIKPIAEKIAADVGASVAVMNTNNLLWYSTEADITGMVIDQLRAKANSSASTTESTDASGPAPDKATE
jgi:Skp family chaperone for outer membrane proteins